MPITETQEVVFAEIEKAASRIRELARETPVITSHLFNQACGAEAFFKCENLQRGGAFKIRGAANFLLSLNAEERKRGVVTFSSGNHAQAVAIAASHLGVAATIVMPKDAPQSKLESTQAYGPKIVFHDRHTESREAIARAISEETGAIVLPSYDHPWIVAGQGTATLELLRQQPDLDTILVPLGGGGLLSGALIAAKALRPEIRVFGVEPALANDWYLSLQSGKRVEIPSPPTIADGLRTPIAGPFDFFHCQQARRWRAPRFGRRDEGHHSFSANTHEAAGRAKRRSGRSCAIARQSSGQRSARGHHSFRREYRLVAFSGDLRGRLGLSSLPDNPWQTHSSRIVYSNAWIRVREDQVTRPDGGPGIYSVVEIRPSVGIVALNERDEIVLVGQWRYPHNHYSWEIPRGGSHAGEIDMLEVARRELAEEAGVQAGTWQILTAVDCCNGVVDDLQTLYLATGLTAIEAKCDPEEDIAICWKPFDEAVEMSLDGRITEVSSMAAILMVAQMRRRGK